jgi:NitT/TauT family transport system permease protein
VSATSVGLELQTAPRRGLPVRRYLISAIGLLAILGYWELHVRLFHVPEFLIPAPSVIAQTMVEEWPSLQRNTGATLIESIGGFIAGNGIAILLAVGFVHSKPTERALYPIAVAIRTVPIIAIAPILVLLFGNGYTPKIIIAALISFFPTLVNMVRGFEAVEPSALELMRVLSASPAQVFWKLRVPSSLPFLFAALKIAATSCVIGAIVSEWIGADTGLGYLITISTFEFRTGLLYAAMVVGSLMALLLFGLVVLAERVIVRWKPPVGPT